MSAPSLTTELEHMEHTLNNVSHRIIFANARRMCKREFQRSPNWVVASNLFGLGSTYSWAMCRRLGIDPEGRTMAPYAKALGK